jgi:hypothetical protein
MRLNQFRISNLELVISVDSRFEFFLIDKLGMVTDEKRHLKLEDVAGLHIGHVSRSLAPYFRDI